VNEKLVVALLAESLLPIPEDPDLNTTISNFYKQHLFVVNYGKHEIEEKEAKNGPFLNTG